MLHSILMTKPTIPNFLLKASPWGQSSYILPRLLHAGPFSRFCRLRSGASSRRRTCSRLGIEREVSPEPKQSRKSATRTRNFEAGELCPQVCVQIFDRNLFARLDSANAANQFT
jgi:hypothetical protein